jgi:transposase
MPGAVVSEVARRHELTPHHLFAWRHEARRGRLALPAGDGPMLVPVVTAPPAPPPGKKPTKEASIAIEVAGIVVRVEAGMNPGWPADVLRAVKAA